MLRDLAHEMDITQGKVNISEIARKTGYDRKTIRKLLILWLSVDLVHHGGKNLTRERQLKHG